MPMVSLEVTVSQVLVDVAVISRCYILFFGTVISAPAVVNLSKLSISA